MQTTLCSTTPAKFVVIKVPALAAGTVFRARTIARTLGLSFFESTQSGMPCSIQMPTNLSDLDLLTEQLQTAKLMFHFSPFNLSIANLHLAVLERTRFFDIGDNFDHRYTLDPAIGERLQLSFAPATA